MPKQVRRAPVSTRAIIQRINRKLAPKYRQLKRCRENSQGWDSLGDYYIVDLCQNAVVDTHVKVESLARELKAIGEWEIVVED